MPSKSRLARLLVPRFGTAWLFVGMLHLIRAAGWWKFHRDLYVEECAAIGHCSLYTDPCVHLASAGKQGRTWIQRSQRERSCRPFAKGLSEAPIQRH